MRPLRLLLSLLACALAFTLLIYHGFTRPSSNFHESSRMSAYFSWRAPSSLFPPSAVISLTDDNSTFFLARPAAFGPLLPVKSLSGQLWIGSGFGDDSLGRNGPGSSQEGELGCSDVPGWTNGALMDNRVADTLSEDGAVRAGKMTMNAAESVGVGFTASIDSIKSDDGTDDHLLEPAAGSGARKSRHSIRSTKISHADIQSLQESAEIAGKIVLLSRGGCGFLDKVKWAQRRDAAAVIIGDDIRGGPLVTMYARGDTSNVSISALFTSHTTAHLLSSLMPHGNKTVEDANRLGVALGDGMKSVKQKSPSKTKAAKSQHTLAAEGSDIDSQRPSAKELPRQDTKRAVDGGSGWFWSIFGTEGSNGRPASTQRPPNTGNVDWIMQTEFDDKQALVSEKIVKAPLHQKPSDGFEIGVHDWRDPDLVAGQKERMNRQSLGGDEKSARRKTARAAIKIKDSSIKDSSAPRSGEYGKLSKTNVDTDKTASTEKKASQKHKAKGLLDRLIKGDWSDVDTTKSTASTPGTNIIEAAQPVSNPVHMHDIHIPGAMYDEITEHEGLWITLTPTSMSNSPFVDTLLVLVVSPLVTLTVVYALLLLRSRIRRRRWRAPKSVVERLPVRTYQTMTSSPTSSITSAISTPATANTPLLSTTSPQNIRPRARSRTDPQLPAQASSSTQSLEQEEEKREAGLLEWRRKYGGKQKECVVCLEEYVDGVSRVMSLPCGHEFHEGCITPWLTTRRRTCPICKGDVVRSMARSHGSTSSMPHDLPEAQEEDAIQEQAVLFTNDDPDSQRPISADSEAFEDLERGMVGHVDRDR